MSGNFSQRIHVVKGIDPIADFNDTTQYTQGVNGKNYSKIVFLVHKGVGTTGTSTYTVLAGSDAVTAGTVGPTSSTAIPFHYKAITATDIEGAYTAATTTGFTTTAGSSQLYLIEVDTEQLGDTGNSYVYLKSVEVVNSPVLGGVTVLCLGPRFAQDIPATAVT